MNELGLGREGGLVYLANTDKTRALVQVLNGSGLQSKAVRVKGRSDVVVGWIIDRWRKSDQGEGKATKRCACDCGDTRAPAGPP